MDCLCKKCVADCLLAKCQAEKCSASCFAYIIKECSDYKEMEEQN